MSLLSYVLLIILSLSLTPHPTHPAIFISDSAIQIKSNLRIYGDLYIEGKIFVQQSQSGEEEEEELDPDILTAWKRSDLIARHALRFNVHTHVATGPISVTARCAMAKERHLMVCLTKTALAAFTIDAFRWGPSTESPRPMRSNVVMWIIHDTVAEPREFVYMYGGDETGNLQSNEMLRVNIMDVWNGNLAPSLQSVNPIDNPLGRTKVRADVDGYNVFMFGGQMAGVTYTSELLQFDAYTTQMTSHGTFGTAVVNAYILLYNDYVYIFGGETEVLTNVLELRRYGKYTEETKVWSSLATLPANANNHFVHCAYDGMIFVYNMDNTPVQGYDIDSNTWTAQRAFESSAPAYNPSGFTWYQNTIFIIGSGGRLDSFMV